jgi:hypothetical protein
MYAFYMHHLADDIYLELPIFMKTRCDTKEEKYSWFVKEREACQKDVERAFGILQSCWAIVWHPARQWDIHVGDHDCLCDHAEYAR